MNPENEYEALSNIRLIATIDLTLATVGLMLDVFVLSEGNPEKPYVLGGKLRDTSFFYLTWGVIFVLLLAQGLMAINLYSGASKFEYRPLKSFKKITVWQIWSIGFLMVLIGAGLPTFVASNVMDQFFRFTITYVIVSILFRLVSVTLIEFNRDRIKREKFFPRVVPPSASVNSKSLFMGEGGSLPVPIYVNTTASSLTYDA